MQEKINRSVVGADVLVMSAAVADYRVEETRSHKIKKGQELVLRLIPNPDILASVEVPGLLKVGFAAETEDLVTNAKDKLARKGLDMIVANDAVAAIGADRSCVTIIERQGRTIELPEMPKREVADRILDRVVALLDGAGQNAFEH
jgi:phosphopantothenoylcysteine decarboxylase / phosphopantothenate---cysteine ligase